MSFRVPTQRSVLDLTTFDGDPPPGMHYLQVDTAVNGFRRYFIDYTVKKERIYMPPIKIIRLTPVQERERTPVILVVFPEWEPNHLPDDFLRMVRYIKDDTGMSAFMIGGCPYGPHLLGLYRDHYIESREVVSAL